MKKKIKILILIIICISISGFIFYNKIESKQNISELPVSSYDYKTEDSGSVADFMDKLKQEEKINFTEENYAGMGKFIESINGIKNSGDKNWIYYVNNKKADIGVSNYQIKNGDIVSWRYEKSY